ncbi:MAG: ABC transporter ATP-binding protein [Bacteroidota bacterium]|nr:ABC transporter ATP-binding protein [Bacteroidota bacterium]
MIIAKNISKSFGDLEVLKCINLEIGKGEVVSIVGSSGAGKTTLLQILGTLDLASGGELEINSTKIGSLSRNGLADFRNSNIGFVFQFHRLLPEYTAIENVMMPAWIRGENNPTVRAERILCDLGLKERLNHLPSELSGGEQQRVAVARALMNEPKVLLADEPSGNLDSENATQLHDLFFELKERLGVTIVIVTHNEELAARADRTLRMSDGAIA